MDLIKLATLIQNKREELGIPLVVAARKAGISKSTLGIIERAENPRTGKPSRPARYILERLAPVLHMSQEELEEALALADYKVTQPAYTSIQVPDATKTEIIQHLASSAPTITEIKGTVYLVHNGYLQAFEAKTGKRLWSSSTSPTDTTPATLSVAASNAQTAKTGQDMFSELIRETKTSMPEIKLIADVEIKYTKGIHAAREIYEEAFSGNEIRSYVKIEAVPKLFSNNVSTFTEAFQKNKKLRIWEIIYDTPASRRVIIKLGGALQLLSENNEGYFYKFIPSDLKRSITSGDIVMYNSKVVFINYEGEVSSTIVQSAELYHVLKELYDFVWRLIPPLTSKQWDSFQEPPNASDILG